MGIDINECRPSGPLLETEVPVVDLSRLQRFRGVSDMPLLMAAPTSRGQFRPLIQFVMVWNDHPELRAGMLDGPPPDGGDKFHLATIAAVVHCLCARDGVPVPAWVYRYKADPERTMSGISVATELGRMIKAEAPPPCAYHGVYVEPEVLAR